MLIEFVGYVFWFIFDIFPTFYEAFRLALLISILRHFITVITQRGQLIYYLIITSTVIGLIMSLYLNKSEMTFSYATFAIRNSLVIFIASMILYVMYDLAHLLLWDHDSHESKTIKFKSDLVNLHI